MNTKNYMLLEADIHIEEASEDLRKMAASIISLPNKGKNSDILFFSGIFVSTGTNLNKAHFMGSEVVKAHSTIAHKAIDIEHKEVDVVGHIYSYTVAGKDGTIYDIDSLEAMEKSELDALDLDVHIAGIIYKNRFPELAQEISDSKWKLSMETYYMDYDIKIGNVILSRKEAESLGIAAQSYLGKSAKVFKGDKEVADGEIAHVLRDLLFSGCGIVKNPAEPRALIFETAKARSIEESDIRIEVIDPVDDIVAGDVSTFTLSNTTVENTDDQAPNNIETSDLGTYEERQQTSVGICVSYKKQVIDSTIKDQNSQVIHTDWCTLYERGCTSPSRGADHPKCLRNQIKDKATSCVTRKLEHARRRELLNALKTAMSM